MRSWVSLPVGLDTTLTVGFLVEGLQAKQEKRMEDLDLFYFEVPTNVGEFTVGKYRPSWGYENFDSIMLTGYAPGMVGVKYSTSVYHMNYEKFSTWLTGERGKLFGHRLEVPLLPGLTLGVKEVAFFAREFDGFWLCYLPFYPFYLTMYIPGVPTTYNNMNVGIDLKIDLFDNIQLYGDFHVTEWPLGPEKTNPPLYGLQLAAYIDSLFTQRLSLETEYIRTTNYLYSHRQEETFYQYKGRTLGTSLGPDAERIGFLLSFDFLEELTLIGGYRFERKGEGKIGDYFSSSEEARENIFLSGIVEKRHVPVLGFDYQISPELRAKVLLEMELLNNADHIKDEFGSRTAGYITLEVGF